jgi:hypothetical protein
LDWAAQKLGKHPFPKNFSFCTMTPEQKARCEIDRQLEQCGWQVQDYRQMDIFAAQGVAVARNINGAELNEHS